jgi:hypothetical protein
MKNATLLIMIYLLISSCSTSRIITSTDGQNYINYDKTNILNWDDFRDKPNNDSTLNGKLSLTINFKEGTNIWWGYQYFEAHGAVFPYDSWVKENQRSDYYLKHFQTLFSMSEIYAIKLLQHLEKNKIGHNLRGEIKAAFDNYNKQFTEMAVLYLKETRDGLDTLRQLFWNNKIEQELQEFENSNY